jgi:hypothetical protein
MTSIAVATSSWLRTSWTKMLGPRPASQRRQTADRIYFHAPRLHGEIIQCACIRTAADAPRPAESGFYGKPNGHPTGGHYACPVHAQIAAWRRAVFARGASLQSPLWQKPLRRNARRDHHAGLEPPTRPTAFTFGPALRLVSPPPMMMVPSAPPMSQIWVWPLVVF